MTRGLSISVKERHKVAEAHRHKVGQVREKITRSPDETRKLAADLAKKLKPGSVLALHGELGSGKTCFVQGLAEALEVEDIVNSPTYTIINEYRGRLRINHVDLYRLKSEADVFGLGLEELLEGDGITAIEWPEKAASILPKNTIHIHFEFVDDRRRRILVPPPRVFSDDCRMIPFDKQALKVHLNRTTVWNKP